MRSAASTGSTPRRSRRSTPGSRRTARCGTRTSMRSSAISTPCPTEGGTVERWATSETIGGKHVLRFVRRLAHPPEKVFRAISEPEELRHWFPARAELELRPGAPIRFTFAEHDAEAPDGEVLEVEAPRLLVLRWGDDVLRFEIVLEPGGCRLHFSQTLAPDGASGGLPGTARNAAGWHVCLARLRARLDGGDAPGDVAWFPLFEGYAERFGLVEG